MGAGRKSKRIPDPSAQPLPHLTLRELLAVLLDDPDMAPDVLATAWPSTIMDLAHRDEYELASLLRLRPADARKLAAALDLHRRLLEWSVPKRPKITEPEDVLAVMAPHCECPVEHFWMLALNAHCHLIGQPMETAMGDVDGVDAGPRAFFRAALQRGAVQAVAVHNHPSCDPSPSAADMAVTRRLVAAGRALDIPLRDHVIVTPDRSRWCSMRRETPACFCG